MRMTTYRGGSEGGVETPPEIFKDKNFFSKWKLLYYTISWSRQGINKPFWITKSKIYAYSRDTSFLRLTKKQVYFIMIN